MSLSVLELVYRLGLACLFGALLGLDREVRGKAAGLRTTMLVALGATVTTVLALELWASIDAQDDNANADPIRAIEGVVGAIGFLGAGAIIQSRGTIHGLTSAANLWLAGAVGIACGAGYFILATVTFAFTVVILSGLLLVERLIRRNNGQTPPEQEDHQPKP